MPESRLISLWVRASSMRHFSTHGDLRAPRTPCSVEPIWVLMKKMFPVTSITTFVHIPLFAKTDRPSLAVQTWHVSSPVSGQSTTRWSLKSYWGNSLVVQGFHCRGRRFNPWLGS